MNTRIGATMMTSTLTSITRKFVTAAATVAVLISSRAKASDPCEDSRQNCVTSCSATDPDCKVLCEDKASKCRLPAPQPKVPQAPPAVDMNECIENLSYGDLSSDQRKEICSPPPPPPKPKAVPRKVPPQIVAPPVSLTPTEVIININIEAAVQAAIDAALANGVTLTMAEREALAKKVGDDIRANPPKMGLEDKAEIEARIMRQLDDQMTKAKKAGVVEIGMLINAQIPRDPRLAPIPGAVFVKGYFRAFFRKGSRWYGLIGGQVGMGWGDFTDVSSKPHFVIGGLAGVGVVMTDPAKMDKFMLALEGTGQSINAGGIGTGGLRIEAGGEKAAFTAFMGGGGGVLGRSLTRRQGDQIRSHLPLAPVFGASLGVRF